MDKLVSPQRKQSSWVIGAKKRKVKLKKSSINKKPILLLITAVLVVCTGFTISPSKIKPEAFGKDKTFALITLAATSKITTDHQSGGLVGMFKGASKSHDFSKDSSRVFAETVPVLLEELRGSKSFNLLPQGTVFQNPAYLSTTPDKPKKWFGVKMVPAEGFKFFKDKKKIKKLVEEMNVDGVILLSVAYRVGFRGANISGISGVGKEKGVAMVAVYAVDKNGKVVWKHATEAVGKKGLMSTGGAANFDKLQSGFVDASRKAAQKLIKKLDKKVGG